jgi:hypothetical protein
LIVKNTFVLLWSFQGARGLAPAPTQDAGRAIAGAGLSKLNSDRSSAEVDVDLGEPACRTAEAIDGTGASGVQELRDP